MAPLKALNASLLFHLNLSYSAIETAERAKVVRRCYRPLLLLAERLPWLVLTVEAPGHTLERIAALDPEWVEHLRDLMTSGRVEFVGSGDTQLIGPLVPAEVNAWNQRLGQATYERLLGSRPGVALVNEMAWSQGIVDAYHAAGYRAVVMEWNNPRRVHPEWESSSRYRTARTRSPLGNELEVLWADTVAFQKLQRAVTGQLDPVRYVEWILAQAAGAPRHLFVYANDAEVFGYRPGRYRAEAPLPADSEREWERLAEILERLHGAGLGWTSPTGVLGEDALRGDEVVRLNDAADPIPVKKQPKYNVTRWALTGRDDVRINARCFARARDLSDRGGGPIEWQELCRAWSSDLRTHLTPARWEQVDRILPALVPAPEPPEPGAPLRIADVREEGDRLVVETDGVRVALLPRQGLAISELTFPDVHPEPLCGTLPHGHFEDIDWAADFYSGHAVLDVPAHQRITDLERGEPRIRHHDDRILVQVEVPTTLGPFTKSVCVYADRLETSWRFSSWGERPACSLRAGFVTLLDGGLGSDLSITCANGGEPERFSLDRMSRREAIDHGAGVSPLVSARTSFGATDGAIDIDDGRVALEMTWPQGCAAALPLLTCKEVGPRRFVRLAFSLAEIDETHRPGAELPDFVLSLRGRRLAA